MPFPTNVRDQALVNASRHCCVCHRFRGVKVEVHHIQPESQGGPNELENAITLCFDCHADAGHYNSKHPRGTKFSPNELRRHRDRWHEIVRQHVIRPPDEPDLFYCRYLLCKSFEAFREITLGEMSHVPVEQPFLVSNEVRHFQRAIVESHPQVYRHDEVWGEAFDSREFYVRAHPEVQLATRDDMPLYPYFEASRVPAVAELRDRVSPQDAVTRLLVDSGAPVDEITVALAYAEECGSARFQEIYRIRPLWALYLAATNISGRPLTLSGVAGTEALTDVGYRPFGQQRSGASGQCPLPGAPLPPNATLLVPIATLLGPLANVPSTTLAETPKYLSSGQGQVVAHQDLSATHSAISVIGPAIWPHALRLRQSLGGEEQAIHEFDLANLYTIGRFWEAGSCPHLFAVSTDPRFVHYLRELFGRQPGRSQRERLIVPVAVRELILAELEAERTWIQDIRVNGRRRASGLQLNQGDALVIAVQPGDIVEILGHYTTNHQTLLSPWQRNCLVEDFLIREREGMPTRRNAEPNSVLQRSGFAGR